MRRDQPPQLASRKFLLRGILFHALALRSRTAVQKHAQGQSRGSLSSKIWPSPGPPFAGNKRQKGNSRRDHWAPCERQLLNDFELAPVCLGAMLPEPCSALS